MGFLVSEVQFESKQTTEVYNKVVTEDKLIVSLYSKSLFTEKLGWWKKPGIGYLVRYCK